MIKLENTEVMGWEHAIRGMRNPLNSWQKSDSFLCTNKIMTNEEIDATCGKCTNNGCCDIYDEDPHFIVGPNDYDLMKRLRNAGTDHRKFMRMITVYVDITAPLYFWKEHDQYKVGATTNSCSTMHKIHAKEFTLEDFSCEHLIEGDLDEDTANKLNSEFNPEFINRIYVGNDSDTGYLGIAATVTHWRPNEKERRTASTVSTYLSPKNILEQVIIPILNANREAYLKTKDKKYWWQMIQLLPSSYNQKRTVMLNYEVLANMYKSRKSHKLDEWRELCSWIETLPYNELITGKFEEEE